MSRTSERRARRGASKQTAQPTRSNLNLGNDSNRWLYYGLGALGVLAVLFLGYAVYAAAVPPVSGPAIGTPVPSLGQLHVNPGQPHATYNSTPPTSGPHYPFTADWRLYKKDEPIPEELWIHNLEHGGIVILYNCPQDCPELISKLEELYKTGPRSKYGSSKLVIAPHSKITTKLALAAWTYYMLLDDYNDELVRGFIKAHIDKGPEDVP